MHKAVAKLNSSTARPSGTSVLVTERQPSGVNFNGGAGYGRDAQTELFLLGVSNFREDTFNETTMQRDDRYARLVHEVGLADPVWIGGFLPWLRDKMHMRVSPLIGAAEFVRARQVAGIHDDSHAQCLRGVGRRTVDLVQQRPDEPGEIMAYWLENYGRKMPFAFKKGTADAVTRLYSGKSLLRYDSDRRAVRFGDVIDLVHPRPRANLDRLGDRDDLGAAELIQIAEDDRRYRSDLFHAALDRRHRRANPYLGDVKTLRSRAALMAVPVGQRRAVIEGDGAAEWLRAAGMDWKALAGWLQGEMDATAWAAILPSMGYTALLMNLRNFEERGLPDELAQQVAATLCDPAEVARSRVLPMQYLSAYRHIVSDRFAWPLEQALELSLDGIPHLGGRTLILVDTSTSMNDPLSKKSTLTRKDAATLFGLAVARRCQAADVVSFASGYGGRPAYRFFPRRAGEGVLREMRRWSDEGYYLGGGTETARALRENYRGHDRVLIVTDEQANVDPEVVSASAPPQVPMFTWNLAGYQYGHAPSGRANRFVIGGLTDAAFQCVPILERGKHAAWPF